MTSPRAKRSLDATPQPPERRGVCPTLARPMQTGDGLLARLRPVDNVLGLPQLRALAEAAARFGNGIIEITARGSLQVRGLKPETVAPFEAAVLATGMEISTAVAIETPPLAGLDRDELADVRPLAETLRRRIAEHVPPLVLAPKLAIAIDGGGRFHLGDVAADVKVSAFREEDKLKFVLAVATRVVAMLDGDQVVDGVMAILERLTDLGPSARGKDLDLPWIEAPSLGCDAALLVGIYPVFPNARFPGVPASIGTNGDVALGLALAYSQTDSSSLIAFANDACALGARDIRLAPDHGFFVTGLDAHAAALLRRQAATLGFLTNPDDPRRSVALCAGSRGCASAFFDTRALATELLAQTPDLLDGSLTIHLSGCAKGCAHPAASFLTVVGTRAGYGLVVNGAASAETLIYVAENDVDIALQRLQALLRQSKEDGESSLACLERLGAGTIAAALQLDRT